MTKTLNFVFLFFSLVYFVGYKAETTNYKTIFQEKEEKVMKVLDPSFPHLSEVYINCTILDEHITFISSIA